MISGTRKPPPISTSSPRDTITSRPRASAPRASSTAAALLLTTMPASAPHAWARSVPACSWRDPRAPASRRYSRFEYPVATSAAAASEPGSMGARPRLVCTITPVAFTTRCRRPSRSRSTRPCASATTRSSVTSAPPEAASRAASTAVRAHSTSNGWGRPSRASTTRSTLGTWRRGSVGGSAALMLPALGPAGRAARAPLGDGSIRVGVGPRSCSQQRRAHPERAPRPHRGWCLPEAPRMRG